MQTDDDDISMLKDDNGKPILPSEEFRSNYYAILEYLNEAFIYEVKELINLGKQYIQNKTMPTGCMILANPQMNEIPKNAIIVSNTKIVNLIQKYKSSTAKQHKGEAMPNPMTRINFNFDQVTGKAEFKLFDK